MTRDEFVDQRLNDGPVVCGEGRQVFLVAIASEGHQTETHLRQALVDYFGSLAVGVKRVEKPSADMVIGEHPSNVQ